MSSAPTLQDSKMPEIKKHFGSMVGDSSQIQSVYQTIEAIAPSDANVVIIGETGTGKELVARAVHSQSPRRGKPFVAVNCAALTETLLESELFGHEKGSFTGAYTRKDGLFTVASEGTLFLDEMNEMPKATQPKLYRALQAREFMRVGGTQTLNTNARVISASSKTLDDAVREGSLTEALRYRLDVVSIYLPPLRDRKEDIPLLAIHLLQRYNQNGQELSLDSKALDFLTEQDWPGNIRQLEAFINRAVVLKCTNQQADKGVLTRSYFESLMPSGNGKDASVTFTKITPNAVADRLYEQMVNGGESFWTAVHQPYMNRDITNSDVREIVHKGLEETHGSYKIVARMFNIPKDYKMFLNFLRKHELQLPFHDYRH